MKEHPILMKSEMVRAILDGRKTQTRRILTPQPDPRFSHLEVYRDGTIEVGVSIDSPNHFQIKSRFGGIGDRLWIKETSCIAPPNFAPPDDSCIRDSDGELRYISYRADGHSEQAMRDYGLQWKPSIFMPRWASRITLEITNVRVERLNDVSRGDCMAEGCPFPNIADGPDPRRWYADLWESINGIGAWDKNPWVWVIEFKRVEMPK